MYSWLEVDFNHGNYHPFLLRKLSVGAMDPSISDRDQKDQAFFSNMMMACYGKTTKKEHLQKKTAQK